MAKNAPKANYETSRAWERTATRNAILDAARRVAEREGVPQTSLNRVAREANFAPTTVYAYFTSKNDLVQAVIAADLATLARAMQGTLAFKERDSEEAAANEPELPFAMADEEDTEPPSLQFGEADRREVVQEPTADEQVASPIEEARADEADAIFAEAVADPQPVTPTPSEQSVTPIEEARADRAEHPSAEAMTEPEPSLPSQEPPSTDTPQSAFSENFAALERAMAPARECDDEKVALHGSEQPVAAVDEETVAPSLVPPNEEERGNVVNGVADRELVEERTEEVKASETEDAPAEAIAAPTPAPSARLIRANRMSGVATPSRPDQVGETSVISVEAIAQLQETVAKLETRPVDAWLERRLREFERGLAALESKLEKSGDTNAPARPVVEQTLRELRERLDLVDKHQHDTVAEINRSLNQRIDVSERRLHDSISDMQTALAQSSRRLDGLENAAFAASPEFFRGNEVVKEVTTAVDAAGHAEQQENEAVSSSDLRHPETTASFISAARHSANAAALTQLESASTSSRARWLRDARTLYMAGGCLAIVFLLVAASLFFRSHAVNLQPVKIALSAHHPAGGAYKPVGVASGKEATSAVMKSRLVALANAGNAKAELLLALDELDTSGGARNESLAAQWLARAASRGDAVAQYRLGALYQDGHGVPADPVQAFHWYESAAMQGNRKAMHSLAVAYAEGWGTPKNLSEAARWFSRAAGLGYVNAQFNLGVLYERGLGVPQSLLDAYKWYAIAAAQGDSESAARVEALKAELGADDLAVAQKGVETFKPEPMVHGANFAPLLSDLTDG